MIKKLINNIKDDYKLYSLQKEIETTYKNAISAGDKNVYFIDGQALTELCEDSGTVDGIHPTDFGFASMAKAVSKVLAKINVK